MCILGRPHLRFDKIHIQLDSTRTTCGCLHLFLARTAKTTFVDMTLGCARMWVAHMDGIPHLLLRHGTKCLAKSRMARQMLCSVGKCPMFCRYFTHCNPYIYGFGMH